MRISRRTIGLALIGAGFALAARLYAHPSPGPGFAAGTAAAQDAAPNRREFTITARDYRFSPARIEVSQDDLVKLTIRSEDVAYSVTIDDYRVSRRIPAGGVTTLEFRADRPGRFPFYSNLTSDSRHAQARGELIVSAR
jgi:heme/copper-type cytochrome/quinol oxidase subunit 2